MESIDYEFCGLFMGEGCIDVSQQGRQAHHIRPRVRIGMHRRDRPLLEIVQARYGGSLTTRKSDGSVTWQLTGAKALARVCDVLETSVLHSSKSGEVALLREAISLRANPTRMGEIKREMATLKGH